MEDGDMGRENSSCSGREQRGEGGMEEARLRHREGGEAGPAEAEVGSSGSFDMLGTQRCSVKAEKKLLR
ncbi:hypothetical protein HPP92_009834 [Vanilla planifolia]|uniref:Uncharacterized protein n=1 Tax=Vanilla planifolia TaxID=51239 RepID=A0A835V6P6_VANPL|nr:hypothetical protein HPP92_009834 [Vanilla planifolia]